MPENDDSAPEPGVFTEAQLDGSACVFCASFDGEMMPVAYGPRGQLFAHPGRANDATRQ